VHNGENHGRGCTSDNRGHRDRDVASELNDVAGRRDRIADEADEADERSADEATLLSTATACVEGSEGSAKIRRCRPKFGRVGHNHSGAQEAPVILSNLVESEAALKAPVAGAAGALALSQKDIQQ